MFALVPVMEINCRLTIITPLKRNVYGTVWLNRPNKGADFGRSESTKDGQTFFAVQALRAAELTLDLGSLIYE